MTVDRSGASRGLEVAIGLLATLYLNLAAWAFGFHLSGYFMIVGLAAMVLWLGFRRPAEGVILASTILICALMVLSEPATAWDARSIWLFHAKRIWADGSLYAYSDSYAPWSHNDYPPLFAALAASFAKSLGYWNEVFPRLSVIILFSPALFVIADLLEDSSAFTLWLAAFIAIFSIKNVGFISGYMDVILGLYYAAIILLLTRMNYAGPIYLSKEREMIELICLIFLIAALPLIKNEGVFGALIIIAFISLASFKKTIKLALILSFLPFILLWKIPTFGSGVQGDIFTEGIVTRAMNRINNKHDFILIIRQFIFVIGPTVAVFLLFMIINSKYRRHISATATFCILYCLGLFSIYAITPYNLAWHLETSADRTLSVIVIVVLSYIFLIFSWSKRLGDASMTPDDKDIKAISQ